MCCRIVELRDKQVICIKNACVIGCVGDVEIDTCSGKINAVVVYGKKHFFGLFGREEDCIIPWCDIEVIGQDTILVGCEPPHAHGKFGLFRGFFNDNRY